MLFHAFPIRLAASGEGSKRRWESLLLLILLKDTASAVSCILFLGIQEHG